MYLNGNGGNAANGGNGADGNDGVIKHTRGVDRIQVTAGVAGEGGSGGRGIHQNGYGDPGVGGMSGQPGVGATGNSKSIGLDVGDSGSGSTGSTDIEVIGRFGNSGEIVGASASGTVREFTACTRNDDGVNADLAKLRPAHICVIGDDTRGNSGKISGASAGVSEITVSGYLGLGSEIVGATGSGTGVVVGNSMNEGMITGASGSGDGTVTVSGSNTGTVTGAAGAGKGTVSVAGGNRQSGRILGFQQGDSIVTVSAGGNDANAVITGIADGSLGSATDGRDAEIHVTGSPGKAGNSGTITGVKGANAYDNAKVAIDGGGGDQTLTAGGEGNASSAAVTGTTGGGDSTIKITGGDALSNGVGTGDGGTGNAGTVTGTQDREKDSQAAKSISKITVRGGTGSTGSFTVSGGRGGVGNRGTINAGTGIGVAGQVKVIAGDSGTGNSSEALAGGDANTGTINATSEKDPITLTGGNGVPGLKGNPYAITPDALNGRTGGAGGTANSGTIASQGLGDKVVLTTGKAGNGGDGAVSLQPKSLGTGNAGNGGQGGHANTGEVKTGTGLDVITLQGSDGGDPGTPAKKGTIKGKPGRVQFL